MRDRDGLVNGGMTMKILITTQVRDEILAATREGLRKHLEFGGSLLAIESAGVTLIAYAVPTGPGASQGAGHIITDAGYQSHAVARVQASLPRLAYVGDWHVHPMRMPFLSGTDLRTAKAILEDPEVGRSSLVLLLGSLDLDDDPEVFGFVVRPVHNKTDAQPVSPSVVDLDAPEVVELLGKPLPSFSSLMESAPGQTAEVRGGSRRLLRRIEQDLKQIRTELGAKTELLMSDELFARVQRGSREAVVLFPPEYPIGAPRIFSGHLEEGPLVQCPLIFGWSSRHSLADALGEILREAPFGPPADTKPRHSPLPGIPPGRVAHLYAPEASLFAFLLDWIRGRIFSSEEPVSRRKNSRGAR